MCGSCPISAGCSERRACRVIGQHRSTQRYQKRGRDDDADLTGAIIELARMYGRYGYRRIWGLLCLQGWQVSLGRVERIWRREGLKVPSRQPRRARLWRPRSIDGCFQPLLQTPCHRAPAKTELTAYATLQPPPQGPNLPSRVSHKTWTEEIRQLNYDRQSSSSTLSDPSAGTAQQISTLSDACSALGLVR